MQRIEQAQDGQHAVGGVGGSGQQATAVTPGGAVAHMEHSYDLEVEDDDDDDDDGPVRRGVDLNDTETEAVWADTPDRQGGGGGGVYLGI